VTAWVVRRVAASVAIVFAVVTLTFFLMALAPGEEMLGQDERQVDPQVREELRRQFGLDQPPLVRYVRYLGQLARGNLGVSFALHRPVADALAEAMPNTLLLAGAALFVDFLVGLALGIYQALRVHRLPDVVLGNVTLFLYSVPTFWLALILRRVVAVVPRRRDERSDHLPQRRLVLLCDGPALAPGAAGADARIRRSGGDGSLPTSRDARGRRPGLHPHGEGERRL